MPLLAPLPAALPRHCQLAQQRSPSGRKCPGRDVLRGETPARIANRCASGTRSWSESHPQSSRGPAISPLATALRILDSQFLPIALALSLMAGYTCPELALRANEANISKISTFVIFVISGMGSYNASLRVVEISRHVGSSSTCKSTFSSGAIAGLNMRRGEAMQAMRSRKAFLYGLLSILFISPFAGKILMQFSMEPFELILGLAIFVCMPTSLSANIALAGAVGANTAMSILLTTASNVISIFTVPVMLSIVLGTSGAIHLDVLALIHSLIRTVLLPLFLGSSLRVLPKIRQAMDQNRKFVRNFSTLCLAAVPFTQIGVAKAYGYTEGLTVNVLLKLMGTIVVTLLCIRAFNIVAVNALDLGRRQDDPRTIKRAVVLASSQKTLPIAVTVIMQLGTMIGERAGLAVLPCVLAHFSQVVIDSLLVNWWRGQDIKD